MSAPGKSKLIFSSAVESLLRVSEGNVKSDTEKQLGEMRMFFRKPVEPAYAAELWATAVRLIGADLFPGESADEQHRKLGGRVLRRFVDGFMGRALISAGKILGPQRSLKRMTNQLRTGANFIETRLTTLDDRTHELWISDVSDVPGFYAGLIEAGADYLTGWPDEMRIKERDGVGCTYTLKCTK